MNTRVTVVLGVMALSGACAPEAPPPSVAELVDNPIMLEAAVVRCSANRSETRYEAECINARQAVSIVEAREERERRAAFEAESAAKRQALRQTQQAAAEARRRAEAAEKARKEAEYLAQFGELPPRPESDDGDGVAAENAPGAVLPAPQELPVGDSLEDVPASDGGNAPAIDQQAPADLDAVREELRRRNEGG